MQILIGSAKIMSGSEPAGYHLPHTKPAFEAEAAANALQLAQLRVDRLQELLHVNRTIASENWARYQAFHAGTARTAAVFAYDGMVFRTLAPETLTSGELQYAQEHLMIGSFLYGLLRPLDGILPYRLEGNVRLPDNGDRTMFDFWKTRLTEPLIRRVQADDGILVNLAAAEFCRLFDWKRVERELHVVSPDFKVMRDGRARTVTVYAKMCRGAMARWLLRERPAGIDALEAFAYEGFRHTEGRTFALMEA